MDQRKKTPSNVYTPPHLRNQKVVSVLDFEKKLVAGQSLEPSSGDKNEVATVPRDVENNDTISAVVPASENNNTRRLMVSSISSPMSMDVANEAPLDDSTSVNSNNYNTSIYMSDELKAMKCSIVISGFPVDLPEYSKEAMLEPFFKIGGRSKWIVGNHALVVFSTEAACANAFHITRSNMLKIETVENYDKINAQRKMRSQVADSAIVNSKFVHLGVVHVNIQLISLVFYAICRLSGNTQFLWCSRAKY